MENAESSSTYHNVGSEEAVEQLKNSCRGSHSRGGQIVFKKVPLIPTLAQWDRIEPYCGGLPCIFHGQTLEGIPRSLHKVLAYRRPRGGLNFISRLFTILHIQAGVPGLTIEHFLFDSMHGVLLYLIGAILWWLLYSGFFGPWSEGETEPLEEAMNRNLRLFYKSTCVPHNYQQEIKIQDLGPWHRPVLKAKAAKKASPLDDRVAGRQRRCRSFEPRALRLPRICTLAVLHSPV